MPTRVAVLVVLALAAAGCASGGTPRTSKPPAAPSPTRPAPGCSPARPAPAGMSARTITSQGQTRTYQLYVPASYTGRKPVPVVFNFHGFASSASQQLVYGDFRPRADKDGFVIVAPDGQGSPRHFNLGPIQLAGGGTDDVAFTVELLDSVSRELCVDADRVYAAGMSNGGAMSLALACLASDRFAAVGPVAVMAYLAPCDVARPVPVAGFVGDADPIIPFNGGTVNCCGNPAVPPAPQSAQQWATHNGCDATPTEERVGEHVVRRSWRGCRGGADVDFYVVEGGGHTWPGTKAKVSFLGRTATDVSAVDVLADFFARHPRRPGRSSAGG